MIRAQTWVLAATAALTLVTGILISPAYADSDGYVVSRYIESIVKPKPEQKWDQVIAPQLVKAEQQRKEAEAEAARQEAIRQQRIQAEAEATARAAAVVTPEKVQSPQPLVTAGVGGLLAAIRRCESTNNYRASNGSHFGAYQFDLGTWASVGGVGNPLNASPGEQDMRAQLLMNARGTSPWLASQGCWG